MEPKTEPNEIDGILNLDDPADPNEPPAPDPSAAPGSGDPKDPDKKDPEFQKLLETNKNLSEQIRQIAEENKSIKDFFDKIRGIPDEQKKKEAYQEWLKTYDADPKAAIEEAVANGIAGLKTKVAVTAKSLEVRDAMSNIDKKYFIDWDKDYKKITETLKRFNRDELEKNYEKSLLDACRLAGVLKKKADAPNYTEPHHRGGATRPASPTEAEAESKAVNDRLTARGKKKSDNVFGV